MAPPLGYPKQKAFTFRGFAPLTPNQGLCPWTPLGVPPPDTRASVHSAPNLPGHHWCWRIFGKAWRCDRRHTEFRRRAETGARCDLVVLLPDVVLPTDLGYLALALHAESLQASFVGRECTVHVSQAYKRTGKTYFIFPDLR